MTAPSPTRAPGDQSSSPPTRPTLTAAVFGATLVVSVAALASPALIQLFSRDLAQLRDGQWWRVVTPVLVQSNGWGQLVFNLLGVAVVGAVLEHRMGRTNWALAYLVGGPGSIAILSAWKPTATGGGSSDAVAALIGALAVLLAVTGKTSGREWPAQVYSVFFATYLTVLALGGLVPSIIAGNASIVLFFVARRALSPATLTRACLLVVATGGVLMTVAHDGHGTGILGGTAVASLVLTRHRLLALAGRSRPTWHLIVAVVGVVAGTVLTWVAWVGLLGVDLIVTQGGGQRTVGWLSVSVVAVWSCLAAWSALQWLQRRCPGGGVRAWWRLCLGVAPVSTGGPLYLAIGSASRAGLLCLHFVCAAATVVLLAPTVATPDVGQSTGLTPNTARIRTSENAVRESSLAVRRRRPTPPAGRRNWPVSYRCGEQSKYSGGYREASSAAAERTSCADAPLATSRR